jgi:hypothetical protein
MTISIDYEVAKQNLFDAYEVANDGLRNDKATYWKDLVDELGRLCPYRKSSTFVAALGTAILAKTVNVDIDAYSLLAREGSSRSYSARALADKVWAKNRAYLNIDLGANGANPLNNIPFIGRDSIRAIEKVRNKDGKIYFFDCLNKLEEIRTINDAKAALAGFIASRIKKSAKTYKIGRHAGDHLVISTLSKIIQEFVETDSEQGRRAQAIAASLLAVAFGADNIDVDHVNDPDRHFPLDITVFDNPEKKEIRVSVEVKDKKISGSDILASIDKVLSFKLSNVIYLALGQNERDRDFTKEAERARDLNCRLVLFFEWEEFCKMCISASTLPGPIAFVSLFNIVIENLVKLGVSQEGLDQWCTWENEDV